jgi:decaprenyl-phosphate phosphoribosyltransferase
MSNALEAPEITRGPVGVAVGLLRTARPRQWVKNVLVLAAPFVAGRINNVSVLVGGVIAMVAFALAASGVYLINDAKDVEEDRAHPKKRNRPIAAGIVPVPLAMAASVVAFVAALAVSATAGWQLVLVIAIYEAVQLAYCFGLKHQPVIELCIVASGFLMRAIGGGVATHIALSQWFLLVTAFGSLFMAAGKRYSEIRLVNRTGAQIRKSLERYSESYLRFVWAIAASIVIMSYGLWAFDMTHKQFGSTWGSAWAVASMVPFVVGVLRYAVDVDQGNAGAPEDLVLKDRMLQVLGLSWVVMLGVAYYS